MFEHHQRMFCAKKICVMKIIHNSCNAFTQQKNLFFGHLDKIKLI